MSECAQKHVVCLPFPAQGHINPIMQLAKLLHSKGARVTFVNSEFNHRRLLKSLGPEILNSQPDFRFEAIPDGLPPSDPDATQDILTLFASTAKTCYAPFIELLRKLNSSPEAPPVSYVIADAAMFFGLDAGKALGIPGAMFWTASACALLAYGQYRRLVERGIIPFKDENFTSDGTLDIEFDFIPGLKNMRVKDLPCYLLVSKAQISVDPEDPSAFMWGAFELFVENLQATASVILNTFEELDREILDAVRELTPAEIYTVGPLHLLGRHFLGKDSEPAGLSLWKNDTSCIDWLNKWEPKSVIYVNYGSITTISEEQHIEFAWGLANSKLPFLWIVRPDMVKGGKSDGLPRDFLDEVKKRGFITTWCPQSEVMSHPSVGLFLSHCGWNSVLESISVGVPLICWPFSFEQPSNSRYACANWGIGLELSKDAKRDEVTATVEEALVGIRGKEIRQRTMRLRDKAVAAIEVGGSSYNTFNRLLEKNFH